MAAANKCNSGKRVAVVSKLYCSEAEEMMVVRRRPHVVNGGGFVVTDSGQNVVFKVEGCGVLGNKGVLLLRDGSGQDLLLIQKKGGMVEALSIHSKWRGYTFDYQGSHKPLFTLVDPKNTCCFPIPPSSIKIFLHPSSSPSTTFFQVHGYFPARACSILDSSGFPIAQIGARDLMGSADVYQVAIKPGADQAFVFGVIAVLDYIYGESTTC